MHMILRALFVSTLVLAGSAERALGQQTAAVAPGLDTVLLENDNVRVSEYSPGPGELKDPHADAVKFLWMPEAGKVRIRLRETPLRFLLVEPKGGKFTQAERSMDPAVVNPSSIAVRLENESLRVMEATLPPGFREVTHTHPGYVMYILEGGSVRLHMADGRTRDSEFKAGAVFYSDPITHWAENTGSTTIRVMIVELRKP
jgi:quercetin dioxygenase-like cupin family protein